MADEQNPWTGLHAMSSAAMPRLMLSPLITRTAHPSQPDNFAPPLRDEHPVDRETKSPTTFARGARWCPTCRQRDVHIGAECKYLTGQARARVGALSRFALRARRSRSWASADQREGLKVTVVGCRGAPYRSALRSERLPPV
jgi:hypothetical protein